MIAFSLIPPTIRTPGIYAEFDSSKAVQSLATLEHRVLLLVQRRSSGTRAQGQLDEVRSADDGKTFYGDGSLGHHMVQRAVAANSRGVRIFAMALDDNGAGTAATGSVTFGGPATGAGTLYGLIAGRRVQTGVTVGMTAAQIATAVAASINALTELPGTAAVDGVDTTKVNWTHRHKGLVGNEVDIRFNYNPGEEFPSGVTATVVQPSGGTANPDVTTAIAALGDEWFTDIAMPWSDSTNLGVLETELADRWGPLRPIDGHAYVGKRDSVGNLSTFGNGRNSQFITTLGINGSPTPAYEIGAVLASIAAQELQQHPARPLTSVILPNVLAPVSTLRFGRSERDILLHDGISTTKVAPGGGVAVDRLITMYQVSPAGTLDESYLDLNTMAQLSYLRFSFRVRMAQRFERSILAEDSNNVDAGQFIVTPNSARIEVLALFEEWERAGLVTGVDQFKQDLRVELSTDPVRLDVLLPPNLTNPLLILAAKFEFRR